MLSKIRKFIKSALYDPANDRTYELTAQNDAPVTIRDADGHVVDITENGEVKALVDYSQLESLDLYMYRLDATLVISSNTAIDDTVISVVSSTGAVVGDAITIYEGSKVFQSLIKATTATSVTLYSQLDYAFTTSAIVECGPWSMNVDGSSTDQIFLLKSPPDAKIEVHSIRSSMLDSSDMDDGLFGGISALTNGVLMRLVNGTTRNLALLFNNIGFFEEGYTIEYADKAPSGQYGVRFRRSIPEVNGVVFDIDHEDGSLLEVFVRDDLTGLDLFTVTIHGHIKV